MANRTFTFVLAFGAVRNNPGALAPPEPRCANVHRYSVDGARPVTTRCTVRSLPEEAYRVNVRTIGFFVASTTASVTVPTEGARVQSLAEVGVTSPEATP